MRQVRQGLAAALLTLAAAPAAAQQGSLQVSGAAQVSTGDRARLGDEDPVEPDAAIAWLQPGSRFGAFQFELRGTRRGDLFHLGRIYASLRDLKYRDVQWSVDAGDALISPVIGEYRFSNLFTPPVTFNGVALSGRTAHTGVTISAGRATAWRNIFGSDPETLDQSIVAAQAAHRFSEKIDVLGRASRVITSDMKEFTFSIADSRQAGGGVRFTPAPAVQLIADGAYVQYRRVDRTEQHHDGSFVVGTNLVLARGWAQANVSRFSPGEFPALNYPLQDREALFASAEYDVWSRVRIYGGWERFRTNLNPGESPSTSSRNFGSRGFGGARVRVGDRSSVTFRVDDGDRVSRPVRGGRDAESDTGSWAAEWQAGVGSLTAFARYAHRENVDRASLDSTYTQHDTTAQFFLNLARSAQIFGNATVTRNTIASGGGNTYWQAGGGAQLQVPNSSLWMRGEATASRNVDFTTEDFVPRESLNVGINGQIRPQLSIGFNVYAERAPSLTGGGPWSTRSTLRITQSFATGSTRVGSTSSLTTAARSRGTGTVLGAVFADWNANGTQDADEATLPGIPVRLAAMSSATTGRDGQFTFLNVPAGFQRVGLDTSALPVDFDAPSTSDIEIELSRGDTRRVAFGLIPLGSVKGRVVRDVNANGKVDEGDEPIHGAILILDGGLRSEQVRGGRFSFDSIRAGTHTVKLLLESMPSGASIAGPAELQVSLTRDALTVDVGFAVSIEKRPEVRKVFPPKGGGAAAPVPRSSAGAARPASPPAPAAAKPSAPPARTSVLAPKVPPVDTPTGGFAIQIMALHDPLGAKRLVEELKAAGYPAFLVEPEASDPDGPYRVRVGVYPSRAAAQTAVASLQRQRGGKLWVIKAR
jgi:cell division septation protein DedD